VSERLSRAAACRIALAAQGFGRARPAAVGQAQLGRLVARLGLHQIDSVNVFVRAHYLPAFARLGAYDRSLLDRAAWGPQSRRRLFEYWAHEASLLPLAMHPLLRWRMAQAERGEIGWGHLRAYAGERRPEAEAILARLRSEGPLAASDFEGGKGKGGWWEWGDTKRALEWLFWAGLITTATRRASFERVYDLTERVIPPAILALPTPPEADARRALVAHAAAALGVAGETDLRDYFRLKPEPARRAVAELVEEGMLVPATVEGWTGPSGCSASATGSRSTRPPKSVPMAITSSRSCSTSGWSRGSTSRPTGKGRGCWCRGRRSSPALRATRGRGSTRSSPRWRAGWASTRSLGLDRGRRAGRKSSMLSSLARAALRLLAFALAAGAAPAVASDCTGTPSPYRLFVNVDKVRDNRGLIAVTLYTDDRSRFLAKRGSLYVGRVAARQGRTRVCIHVPRPGTYALAVYHDADADRSFDRTGLGLPAEGFGFSNNPPTFLGLPNFNSVRIRVPRTGLSTAIRLHYR
jgi:uncharacterized protein